MLKKKSRKKCLTKRMSEPLGKKGSFRRYPSCSSMDMHKSMTKSKSCTHQDSMMMKKSTRQYDRDGEIDAPIIPKELTDENPITSLMSRFGSLFQRRGSTISKTPESKQSPLSQSSSSICHMSSNKDSTVGRGDELSENMDKVRNELLTLEKFQEAVNK